MEILQSPWFLIVLVSLSDPVRTPRLKQQQTPSRHNVCMYLSVRADDDLSEVVVHGGHRLADRVQGHVHLPFHPVTIR